MSTSDPKLHDKIKRHLSKMWKCKTTDIHINMLGTVDTAANGPAFRVAYMIRQLGTKVHTGIIPKNDL